jgi:hypothetical protein
MIDKETDIVTVEFDEDSQEYYISSPIFEKHFKAGDSVEWTEQSPGVYILTKAKNKRHNK